MQPPNSHPQTPRWFVVLAGTPQGPYEQTHLINWIASGQIQLTVLVCPEGGNEWHPAHAWPALFPQKLRVASPPPLLHTSAVSRSGKKDRPSKAAFWATSVGVVLIAVAVAIVRMTLTKGEAVTDSKGEGLSASVTDSRSVPPVKSKLGDNPIASSTVTRLPRTSPSVTGTASVTKSNSLSATPTSNSPVVIADTKKAAKVFNLLPEYLYQERSEPNIGDLLDKAALELSGVTEDVDRAELLVNLAAANIVAGRVAVAREQLDRAYDDLLNGAAAGKSDVAALTGCCYAFLGLQQQSLSIGRKFPFQDVITGIVAANVSAGRIRQGFEVLDLLPRGFDGMCIARSLNQISSPKDFDEFNARAGKYKYEPFVEVVVIPAIAGAGAVVGRLDRAKQLIDNWSLSVRDYRERKDRKWLGYTRIAERLAEAGRFDESYDWFRKADGVASEDYKTQPLQCTEALYKVAVRENWALGSSLAPLYCAESDCLTARDDRQLAMLVEISITQSFSLLEALHIPAKKNYRNLKEETLLRSTESFLSKAEDYFGRIKSDAIRSCVALRLAQFLSAVGRFEEARSLVSRYYEGDRDTVYISWVTDLARLGHDIQAWEILKSIRSEEQRQEGIKEIAIALLATNRGGGELTKQLESISASTRAWAYVDASLASLRLAHPEHILLRADYRWQVSRSKRYAAFEDLQKRLAFPLRDTPQQDKNSTNPSDPEQSPERTPIVPAQVTPKVISRAIDSGQVVTTQKIPLTDELFLSISFVVINPTRPEARQMKGLAGLVSVENAWRKKDYRLEQQTTISLVRGPSEFSLIAPRLQQINSEVKVADYERLSASELLLFLKKEGETLAALNGKQYGLSDMWNRHVSELIKEVETQQRIKGYIPSLGKSGTTADEPSLTKSSPAATSSSNSSPVIAPPGEVPTVGPQLAIAPFDAAQAKAHQAAWAKHLGTTVEMTNSVGVKMMLIPPGEFVMGSPPVEIERRNDETQHRVRITKAFYLGACEITRGQFARFVSAKNYRTEAERDGKGGLGRGSDGKFVQRPENTWRNPGLLQDDEHPVVHVSWNDAIAFCEWLSMEENKHYRLPTEAEWEYACRAGTATKFYTGDKWMSVATSKGLTSNSGTLPVGKGRPNAFSLYDMTINVWEWCNDWYAPDYYSESPIYDPLGPNSGLYRVGRGGSWDGIPAGQRSAYRYRDTPSLRGSTLGFRIALDQN